MFDSRFEKLNRMLKEHGMVEKLLYRLDEVLVITGLSRSVVYEMMSRREFPAPVRISPRSVAWHREDIEKWVDSRPQAT